MAGGRDGINPAVNKEDNTVMGWADIRRDTMGKWIAIFLWQDAGFRHSLYLTALRCLYKQRLIAFTAIEGEAFCENGMNYLYLKTHQDLIAAPRNHTRCLISPVSKELFCSFALSVLEVDGHTKPHVFYDLKAFPEDKFGDGDEFVDSAVRNLCLIGHK
ncbi:hypothetical protein CAPTEDRAFT_198310 [Capitella teleta]|uniref:Uncharacterized protein n=1 Tax=Capitella teleta TaxID=283909 RepID=R7UAV7_CAPTE|nr:hypothetical protein CAPTEDRAFT_198310 [Capitella teleta]|eukprot:ELU03124.1 hypothetical protein CAPTEDRAFT_198310 [Capitella teleta]